MRNLNKCQFIGRLGKDIELRYTASGKAVANFGLACSFDDKTEWIDLVAFDKQAETLAQYTKKGSKLYVEGRLQKRKWQAQDGSDRYSTEVIINNFEFLDSLAEPAGRAVGSQPGVSPAAGQGAGNQQFNQSQGFQQPQPNDGFDDSQIPF